jgi:diguanylate cyclase (GGDEF)-like protein
MTDRETDLSVEESPLRLLAVNLVGPAAAAVAVVALVDPQGPVAASIVAAAAALSFLSTWRFVLRPISSQLASARRDATRAQTDYLAERRDRELRTRLERALREASTETQALRVGLRGVAEAVPEAGVTLLLAVPGEPRIGWRIELRRGELEEATPFEGTPTCTALSTGRTTATTTRSLEACEHLLVDQNDETCATCVPLRAGGHTIGSVCVTTAPGEPLDATMTGRLEWVAECIAQRAAAHRRENGTSMAGSGDPLTGLPSTSELRTQLRDLVRSLTPFCFAIVEIDRLDDLDGEDADAALVVTAQALTETVRPDDVLCRLDRSRFAAVLPNCSSDQAVAVMERLRENLVLMLTDGDTPLITCSAGVVESRQASSLEEIVQLATSACDDARLAGGNRVAVWDSRTSSA